MIGLTVFLLMALAVCVVGSLIVWKIDDARAPTPHVTSESVFEALAPTTPHVTAESVLTRAKQADDATLLDIEGPRLQPPPVVTYYQGMH